MKERTSTGRVRLLLRSLIPGILYCAVYGTRLMQQTQRKKYCNYFTNIFFYFLSISPCTAIVTYPIPVVPHYHVHVCQSSSSVIFPLTKSTRHPAPVASSFVHPTSWQPGGDPAAHSIVFQLVKLSI